MNISNFYYTKLLNLVMAAFPILGFYFPPRNEDRLPVSESSEIFVEKNIYILGLASDLLH